MLRSIRIFVLLVLFSIQNQIVNAQIILNGADYSQNFNGLASSTGRAPSTTSTMPPNWSFEEFGTGTYVNGGYTASTGSIPLMSMPSLRSRSASTSINSCGTWSSASH